MSLLGELRRRNVLRVATAYAAVSWLIVQVAETLFPIFGLSDTAIRAVVVILVAGFVPAVILAWVFEWTPEGFRRDAEVDRTSPASRRMAKRLDRAAMVVLALAVGYFAFDKFMLAPQREAEVAEEAREAGRTAAMVESFGDMSIAVLPFTDMSPDRDHGYFSDGIAEELLNLLAGVNELRVISRSSSFALRDENLSTPEIAQRLNVGYVLEGSVRKAGNTIRITAQLIDGRSDTHVWSQTWDRDLDDVFAIQDEISAQVVDELKVELLAPAPSTTVTDTDAFEAFLKGRYALAGRNLQEAEDFFAQSIAIDPGYAPAHAGLAKALLLQVAYQVADLAETRNRAEAAVDRALELDPDDSDALAARGFMYQSSNPEIARDSYERAIAANPTNSDAYRWLALSYSRSAEPARYLEYARLGHLVDPVNMNYNLVLALMRFGLYDEAIAAARSWHENDPGTAPYAAAQKIHLASGDLVKSIKTAYAAYRLEPGAAYPIAWIFFDEMGDLELANAWREDSLQSTPDNQSADFLDIAIAKVSGDRDRALKLLAEIEAQHPEQWYVIGRSNVLSGRNYEHALEVWERGRLDSGASEPSTWEPDSIVDYALALQRTGESERAEELIGETLSRIEAQIEGGLVGTVSGVHKLVFYAATLHALRGDTQQAMEALREDFRTRKGSCYACLHGWPHFDDLHGNPEFDALLAELDAHRAAVRQQLIDEGMLLTPDEVRALEDFDFDPFER
jgi:TolB-like protein/tetratricopeptide (TPR) repeat protein